MPPKKPKLLENFCPRRDWHIAVDIFLANDYSFFFEFSGETYTADTIHSIRSKAREVIEASLELHFVPVIDATVIGRTSFARHPVVGIKMDRYYIAKRPDGKWLRLGWHQGVKEDLDREEALRFARHDHSVSRKLEGITSFDQVHIQANREESVDYLIPYSEDLWQGLEALQKAIEVLRGKIDGLLSSGEGRELISASVMNLLGSGGNENV